MTTPEPDPLKPEAPKPVEMTPELLEKLACLVEQNTRTQAEIAVNTAKAARNTQGTNQAIGCAWVGCCLLLFGPFFLLLLFGLFASLGR